MMSSRNRIDLTELMLVQWSKFTNVHIKIKGSTLFTGVNGSGKSTILDAMSYLLTGNTQFNKAAQDKDRTVLSYIRGDTRSNGADRYLRQGAVVSYLAAEFYSSLDRERFVVGVCMESPDETGFRSFWFVRKNAGISDFHFYEVVDGRLHVAAKNELYCGAEKLRTADFMPKERGIEQVMRALGLRCEVSKYRSKLMKMMAFSPENNIDRFIAQSVLEPKPIHTITIVREQKQKFDQIKQLYGHLLKQKEKLKEIGETIDAYEKGQEKLRFYQTLHKYQEMALLRGNAQQSQVEQRVLEKEMAGLQGQIQESRQELESARVRLREAEDACRDNDLDRSLQQIRSRMEQLQAKLQAEEQKTAELQLLQDRIREASEQLCGEWGWSREDSEHVVQFCQGSLSAQEAYQLLLWLKEQAGRLTEKLMQQKLDCQNQIKDAELSIGQLEKQRQQLENHKMVYDQRYEKERKRLLKELEKKGIQTDVRFLCELVASVKEPEWQAALEVFLGHRRYHLIVEEEYRGMVLRLIRKCGFRNLTVVLADAVPEREASKGSAAEILEVPNASAARYVNYLLGSMILCDSLEQLQDNPSGGITKDGMLAKSYTVSHMNMDHIQYCLGTQAMELQIKQIDAQLEQIRRRKAELKDDAERIGQKYGLLKSLWIEPDRYDFDAPARVRKLKEQQLRLREDKERIQKDPGFMDLIDRQKEAQLQVGQIEEKERQLLLLLGQKENEKKRKEEQQKKMAGQLYLAEQAYEETVSENEDLRVKVPAEYEMASAGKKDGAVITASALRGLEEEKQKIARKLEDLQFAYGVLAEENGTKRGIAYIPYYRTLLNEIGNIRAEETKQRLELQHKKLESAFMNEFVSELVENIQNARREILEINRELENLPFGNDVYTFKMKPRSDKTAFFQIADKIAGYMNHLDAYMAMNQNDEELEHHIQAFLNLILEDENEEEYADYRNYFQYDMEIANRSSGHEIKTELSAKQGSASGGEKQTPYFIILAASLMQCYPSNICCARLAFIDEAFSALSRERIEQMVCYLEQNQFQVMYAAPPEKIGSIGSFIESTVSLVETGRYTSVVEGLKL